MIPVNEPLLDGNEKEYLAECINTGWISSEGPFVSRFEEEFAKYCDRAYGVAVCNGTAALEVALYGAGIRPGQKVIMPAFTIASCAIAAIRIGAIPLLVDCRADNWCMDVQQAVKIIEKDQDDVTAIMPVHIYGHPVEMDPILEAANKYKVKVIEDGAEVHGAKYCSEYLRNGHEKPVWKKCGSFGLVSSFSFYPNKIITTGEGGMIVTDDHDVYERAKSYRNLCFGSVERFRHEDMGYNFRMSNLQAAVGVAQLERIESHVQKKLQIAAWYKERLQGVAGIRMQPVENWAKPVYWMIAIELDKSLGMTAEDVMQRLKDKKIGTRPFFMGLHAQPAFKYLVEAPDSGCPNADHAYKFGLYLPSGLALKEAEVDTVCRELKEVLVKV